MTLSPSRTLGRDLISKAAVNNKGKEGWKKHRTRVKLLGCTRNLQCYIWGEIRNETDVAYQQKHNCQIRCASAVCAIGCMGQWMFLQRFVINMETKALFEELFS